MTLTFDAAIPSDAPSAPWMPLEGVTELWAAFGKVAHSMDALRATSQAFAALAEEREALWYTTVLATRHQRGPAMTARNAPLHLAVQQESIIACLMRAAAHWYEVVGMLANETQRPPSGEEEEPLPPDLALPTLMDFALAQRERVWAIAHALLLEQVRHLQQEQGGRSR